MPSCTRLNYFDFRFYGPTYVANEALSAQIEPVAGSVVGVHIDQYNAEHAMHVFYGRKSRLKYLACLRNIM